MKLARVIVAAILAIAMVGTVTAQDKKPAGNAGKLARGKYLVEQVGMCADCHSPRDERGQYVRSQWLQGSVLFFKPIMPVPNWTEVAPGIAGLPGWSDKDAVQVLSTGKSMNGRVLNPPMPEVRYSRADAEAVVAYLRSLKPIEASAKPPSKPSKRAGGKQGQ